MRISTLRDPAPSDCREHTFKSFNNAARKRQADFRYKSSTISERGQSPTDDNGRRNDHLLALGCEYENLYPSLRGTDGACRFFRDRRIKWWKSRDETGRDGPTRNMASSQVMCVNFLLPLVDIPGAINAAIRAIDDDVECIVEIHHEGRVSSVEFEWNGLPRSLEGRRGRGAHNTSVDAFVVAETSTGRRAYLMEWKYTEKYQVGAYKGAGNDGERRRCTYSPLYSSKTSAFSSTVPMDELLYDPFYQIMRNRLLADRMILKRELDVSDAKVIVVVPEGNTDFRKHITSPLLAERFPELTTVSDVMRATLKDPDRTFAMICPSKLVESVERRCCMKGSLRS